MSAIKMKFGSAHADREPGCSTTGLLFCLAACITDCSWITESTAFSY